MKIKKFFCFQSSGNFYTELKHKVSFTVNNFKQIGFIKKIFKIKTEIFFLIQKFEKIKNFSADEVLEAKLNEFFSIS